MQKLLSIPFRLLPVVLLGVAALLGVSGCEDNPFVDDYRVVKYSPGYLRSAYIYANKDAVSEADENFRVGDCRLYGAIGFGTYYPGCAPGIGERLARKHGTILLTKTATGVDIDARDDYQHTVLAYAATYNAEMVHLLGASKAHSL